ncbi:MAG: UDP-N-acetylglucosamine 1-carboxyvinyltransferase [Clostridiales Family XIII bacterium]|nr:UDP-N-acetylglucosamine 1-carboxyvinyltransferase [Clostridiales Family XIII bacterium]
MSKIIVKKSPALKGCVEVSGSKNAVLPLLAATLLTEDECVIGDVPDLKDVDVMCMLLESFGAKVTVDKVQKTIHVQAKKIRKGEVPEDLVMSMRASVVAMGPVLARTGYAKLPLPGGCAIGERPIDLHLKGFHALGADVETETETKEEVRQSGYVLAKTKHLRGAEIYLDTPSVGATENIMLAASLATGMTILENAAEEPEIIDLANYLNKMGARIKGAGTNIIKIEGVSKLHGAKHSVIPDRIEAGTYMLAAAITKGDVLITNMLPNHVKPVIAKLRECGVSVEDTDEGTRVFVKSRQHLSATNIKTLPYPGFPTDMQPQFMTFLSMVSGSSIILESVFENRFMHIAELNKMNANIIENGRKAIIPGGGKLVGAEVKATDLRAGAALILAGLAAKGTTEISDIYHIERGYDNIVGKLASLGANAKIVE